MSICRGVAGQRGRNPVGIFIHNDAGSQNANAAFYSNWLQTHNLENGFAHYYVASDGILQTEDDHNRAWHCGQTDGNNNYLGIEVCQSMGDLNVFKSNEDKALNLAATKCKQYGIIPSPGTIRLHQEVYATACPHRSVEVHGGASATQAYFIQRIKELMVGGASAPSYEPTPPSQPPTNNLGQVDAIYQVFTDRWWSPVTNKTDWAGAGDGIPLRYLALRVTKGSVRYRVHTANGWLGWITGCNISDLENGCAGDGSPIDAVEIYYITPDGYAYKRAVYRVSDLSSNEFYADQHDSEVGNGQDGYAGVFGIHVDKLQIWIE